MIDCNNTQLLVRRRKPEVDDEEVQRLAGWIGFIAPVDNHESQKDAEHAEGDDAQARQEVVEEVIVVEVRTGRRALRGGRRRRSTVGQMEGAGDGYFRVVRTRMVL